MGGSHRLGRERRGRGASVPSGGGSCAALSCDTRDARAEPRGAARDLYGTSTQRRHAARYMLRYAQRKLVAVESREPATTVVVSSSCVSSACSPGYDPLGLVTLGLEVGGWGSVVGGARSRGWVGGAGAGIAFRGWVGWGIAPRCDTLRVPPRQTNATQGARCGASGWTVGRGSPRADGPWRRRRRPAARRTRLSLSVAERATESRRCR